MKLATIPFVLLVAITFSFAQEKEKERGKADLPAMFAKKDANGDAKLSKEEYTKGAEEAVKAEKTFAKLDKDKDGSLSFAEFMAAGEKKGK